MRFAITNAGKARRAAFSPRADFRYWPDYDIRSAIRNGRFASWTQSRLDLDQFAQSRESETASPSEIPTRTGSPRNRRLLPPIPRRATYSLSLPRLTDARSHLVFTALPLQRSDPGLQTSRRRNLSLQPSEILSHPVPPLALVHIPDLSVADTRLCPTVPPEAAGIDRDVPGLQ